MILLQVLSRPYTKAIEAALTIYVTAGTDMSPFLESAKDRLTNLKQVMEAPRQYLISASNSKALQKQFGNNLSFAGHSLGGEMAALDALVTGLHATILMLQGYETHDGSFIANADWPISIRYPENILKSNEIVLSF